MHGMLNGLVEKNPLDLEFCNVTKKACLEMVEEGFANRSIIPSVDCRPRCDSRDFEVSRVVCFDIGSLLILTSYNTFQSTLFSYRRIFQ